MLISFEKTEIRHKGIRLFLSLENLLRIQVVCAGHRHIDSHVRTEQLNNTYIQIGIYFTNKKE